MVHTYSVHDMYANVLLTDKTGIIKLEGPKSFKISKKKRHIIGTSLTSLMTLF